MSCMYTHIKQGTVQLQEAVQVRSSYAFVSALKACSHGECMSQGKILHSDIIRSGFEMDPYVANTLIDMYAKRSFLDDALSVFNGMNLPDLVSWNTIIAGYAQNGCGRYALQFFYQMQHMEIMPNRITYVCVLKACSSICSLSEGMFVHAQIVENSGEANLSVGNSLVDMYAKCGSFENSMQLFYALPERDVVTWSTIISVLCEQGKGHESLVFFWKMQEEEKCIPNHATYFCAIKACSVMAMLEHGKVIHAQVIENGFELDLSVANTLIDMYSKCGNFRDAFKILENLPKRNVVSWTSIVANLAYQGFGWEAFHIFHRMQLEGVNPNEVTYVGILKACSGIKALDEGKLIHAHMIEHDLVSKSMVGNTLLDMYGKCRSFDDARKVFDCLLNRDAASYSAMISIYAQHGHVNETLQLFKEMQMVGIRPNEVTYVSILKLGSNIANLCHALFMHSHIIKHGFDSDIWVCNSLINMYVKCGSIDHACKLFHSLTWHDVVSWSALITGYAESGHIVEAFTLFERMQNSGVRPNKITFIAILKACSTSTALNHGMLVNDDVVKYGNDSDICVANALIHMYTACGALQDAMIIFNNLQKRDVVTWTVIIAAHVLHECFEDALFLFYRMQQQGIEPNYATFISTFKSCSKPSALTLGRRLYGQVIEDGFDLDLSIINCVIHMYGKCGTLMDSLSIFGALPKRDVITWSTMIAMLFEYGMSVEALHFYEDMLNDGFEPNHVTLLSILKACSNLSSFEQGQVIHSHICECGLESDISIGNTLIDMYAKCGALTNANRVFDKMARRDVVTWTALIESYTQHQYSQDALLYFGKMMQIGIVPNRVTFLSVLGACCNIIAIEQGKVIHAHIIEHGFEYDSNISSALLDMYTKCGGYEDARKVFFNSPNQDVVAWSSMVSGYAQSNDYKMAMKYFKGMQKQGLKPDDVTFLSLLSACNHAGLLDEGLQHINMMLADGSEVSSEHYKCIIDLFGRIGQLEAAELMLESLPLHLGVVGLTSLLGHSKTHGDLILGTRCFESMLD